MQFLQKRVYISPAQICFFRRAHATVVPKLGFQIRFFLVWSGSGTCTKYETKMFISPTKQCCEFGFGLIRNFFLDPELYASDWYPAKMKKPVNNWNGGTSQSSV